MELSYPLGTTRRVPYLSNTLTNLCRALCYILLYCVVLNCIVLLIYCYVDIIQYNALHKFVGVLDNPPASRKKNFPESHIIKPFIDQACSVKIYGLLTKCQTKMAGVLHFFCWSGRVVPSGQDSSILLARVANHNAGFDSSCPFMELAI